MRLAASPTSRNRKLDPRLVSVALILLYAPVPLAAATALDARSPASRRKQCLAPIRPPAHAVATTRSAPAK